MHSSTPITVFTFRGELQYFYVKELIIMHLDWFFLVSLQIIFII